MKSLPRPSTTHALDDPEVDSKFEQPLPMTSWVMSYKFHMKESKFNPPWEDTSCGGLYFVSFRLSYNQWVGDIPPTTAFCVLGR